MIKYARLMDALLLISFSIFFACSTDINPKANELYVAASKILDEAKNSTNNYMETFQLYAKARQKIDTIIQRYSSSNIAVSLMSGQSKISNLTLEEFKTLEHSLKYLADCDTNPLTCAVLLANKINDPFLLSSSLITIADAYDYVKYERKVIGLLSQAYNSALHITDEKNRIESLSGVAESYAKLGKTEKATRILSEALNIVSSLEDIAHISNSLRYILSACEKIGGTEGILALLSRMYPTVFLLINDDFYKPISFYELACTYTEIEQFDRAIQTALCIADEIWMSAAFSRISDKYVSSNQLEKALEIATKFSKKFSASDKIKNVILIADKYLESGQNTKASNLVFQALEIANSMEGQNSREKVEALTNISDKYILMGDKEKASEVLLLALGSVEDGYYKVEALTNISDKYILMGDKEKASEVLLLALGSVDSIDSKDLRSLRLKKIVICYEKLGNSGKAIEVLYLIDEGKEKIETLIELSEIYRRNDKLEKSKKLLDDASSIAITIDHIALRCLSLEKIAKGYVNAGYYDKALEICKNFDEKPVEVIAFKSEVLMGLAEICIEANQLEYAKKMLFQSLENASKAQSEVLFVQALCEFEEILQKAKWQIEERDRVSLQRMIQYSFPKNEILSGSMLSLGNEMK